jgi:hypothetical protein
VTSRSITRLQSFWGLQLCGWLVYGLATAVSTLPYRHEKDYVAYRVTTFVGCFLFSFALYPVCRTLWRRRVGLYASLAWTAAAAYIPGLLCAAAATWTESRLGHENMPFHWLSAIANATGAWFLLFGWGSCYFGIKHFNESEKQRLDLFASQSLLREAQLQALRYQLQPHFLYNTLNAISTLVLQGKSRQATQMIARLGDLLRETLTAPHTHLVSLAEELITTRLYIAIEQMRFEANLTFVEEISDDVLAALVPRFLLQPLVENAVRHGIAKLSNGGKLLLTANRQGDSLKIEVVNDYSTDSPVVGDGRGLGLSNTRSRLEHLYGEEQSITILYKEAEGKFGVAIRVPYTTKQSSYVQVGALNA